MNFRDALHKKIGSSLYNNFGRENFDPVRFSESSYYDLPAAQVVKLGVKKLISYNIRSETDRVVNGLSGKLEKLEKVYNLLQPGSKKLLIDIIAYRLLGFKKVKINGQGSPYLDMLRHNDIGVKDATVIETGFMDVELQHLQFKFNNSEIELFFTKPGVIVDFILEQYRYKADGVNAIEAEPGETVLDMGGCWGDTAVYFASKVGSAGKVYSFEFIPGNIKTHRFNTQLNAGLSNVIELVTHPVSDVSDTPVYFKDAGPASSIALKPFEGQTGETTTISVDDFMKRNGLNAVHFLKMDIEGAELPAIKGALDTIKQYRPKLAIAVYHNDWDDLIDIPLYLDSLNLNYEFHLGHYTIHNEETVLFGKPL